MTWKVDDGIYQHIDIKEEGKDSAFSLGKSLWIDSEVSCIIVGLKCMYCIDIDETPGADCRNSDLAGQCLRYDRE